MNSIMLFGRRPCWAFFDILLHQSTFGLFTLWIIASSLAVTYSITTSQSLYITVQSKKPLLCSMLCPRGNIYTHLLPWQSDYGNTNKSCKIFLDYKNFLVPAIWVTFMVMQNSVCVVDGCNVICWWGGSWETVFFLIKADKVFFFY